MQSRVKGIKRGTLLMCGSWPIAIRRIRKAESGSDTRWNFTVDTRTGHRVSCFAHGFAAFAHWPIAASLEMFNVNFGSYCNVNLLLTPDLNIVQVLTIVIVVIVVNIVCRQLRTAKAEKIERNETIPTSATSDLTAASVKGHRWLSSHSGTHTSNINTIIQNSFL